MSVHIGIMCESCKKVSNIITAVCASIVVLRFRSGQPRSPQLLGRQNWTKASQDRSGCNCKSSVIHNILRVRLLSWSYIDVRCLRDHNSKVIFENIPHSLPKIGGGLHANVLNAKLAQQATNSRRSRVVLPSSRQARDLRLKSSGAHLIIAVSPSASTEKTRSSDSISKAPLMGLECRQCLW